MTFTDFAVLAVLAAVFLLLAAGPLRNSRAWRAMLTPLASIIGSGFLVSVPLVSGRVGLWAVPAMAALVGVAWLIGGAIRYNIRHGEARFAEAGTGHHIPSIEMLSHLVLTGAYFISVAYYLVLLATFGAKLLGIADPAMASLAASALVAAIALTGVTRGLQGVEKAERITVSANLAAIAALLAALALFALNLPEGYGWSDGGAQAEFDWNTLRFLMGLLIVVQGFETTRFMGSLYDGPTRIRAMKQAQGLSSAVYLVFFALMIPLYPYFPEGADVAGVIEVIGRVSPLLPIVVAFGAIASQFSAAVADSLGASGLVSDTTHGHVTPRHAYIAIGAVAVSVIWATDVTSIVALASRAFALFYALQCLVAMLLAWERRETGRAVWHGGLSALCFAVAVLGIPAG
ncbi:hypothetical protein [Poseidonocella sp. HB161398]|uniref:hypothetical protein n=1 Tax=Poseidonocella sp. HB161398 TaxID=2320855 RepID=UPI001108DBB5|nr:hypothetical protein [Poseidonocella sp. HB161398]